MSINNIIILNYVIQQLMIYLKKSKKNILIELLCIFVESSNVNFGNEKQTKTKETSKKTKIKTKQQFMIIAD